MIIHVTLNNKVFLVDATDKYLNSLILPERCMNAAGFVVYRDSAKWIPITSNKSRSIINTKLILSEDGSLSGDVTLTLDGHRASELRKRYVDAGSEFVREWAQELNVEITDLSVENLDNINESFKIKYKTIATNKGQLSANIMYLDPFVQGKTEDNPFKESIRQYPVDFPSTIDRYYIANIEVPESFQIDELPKTVTLTLPDNGGRFLYSVTLNGKMLNITCQISRNKRVFTLNEYKLLQEFYSQIVTKQSELIVLKKK